MFDAWPSPPAFPSSLVANPAQEAFEESYRDIAKALYWFFLNVGAVLIPLQLHSIKLDLGLGAVSSLPKPLHIEFFCFGEIVFRRVLYFVVK
jgi:hypothetical protein